MYAHGRKLSKRKKIFKKGNELKRSIFDNVQYNL